MNSLKRLQQIVTEDKYDRSNIRERILTDIGMSLFKPISAGMHLLGTYIDGQYYESKMKRLAHLKNQAPMMLQIITEVCVLVLPIQSPQPIQGVAGQLGSILGYGDILEGVKTASEILAVLARSGLLTLIPARDSETGSITIVSNYRLEDSTLDYIAQTKYLPPMVCKPRQIVTNSNSGYLTKNDSIILGKGNHHEGKQALDVINIVNGIALSLDEEMLEFLEEPKKELDTEEKRTNHQRMVNASTQVYQELLNQGNKFWFTHKVDKRGRLYSQGYHVNYQGTSYKKALLNFNNKQVITGE